MDGDRRSWLGWTALLLGAAALLLALGDFALVLSNRTVRRETDEQRRFIEQTAQLTGIRDNLVRQIARAAIEDKDQALRDILVSNGFRIQSDPAAAGAQPAAAPPSTGQAPANLVSPSQPAAPAEQK